MTPNGNTVGIVPNPLDMSKERRSIKAPQTPGPGRNTVPPGLFICLQVVMIVLYGLCTDYADSTLGALENTSTGADSMAQLERYYPFFQHVHVMIFVGFGFLMTFLKKYRFGAVGFTLLVSAWTLQFSILCNGFWHCLFQNHWAKIQLDITSLITGDFAAGAVMITYGALLGKIAPIQMLVLGMLECIFYSINESIGVIEYKAVDMGGSIFVHMFGAFFGVSASMVLTNRAHYDKAEKKELISSNTMSDTFAMIGTIFLWMYWPSFNGALADGTGRHRVVVNTVLALCASSSAAFFTSYMLRGKAGKFNMVDIQNATLAGGVAIGSSSDLVVGAWPSLLIGSISGVLSVVGYTKILPFLEEKLGLRDTCGVLCLHGLPGLMGALGGSFSAAGTSDKVYGADVSTVFPARAGGARTAGEQAGYQMAATITCLIISMVGGVISGTIIKKMGSVLQPPEEHIFRDDRYWDVEGDIDGLLDEEHHNGLIKVSDTNGGSEPDAADQLARLLQLSDMQTKQLRHVLSDSSQRDA